MAIGNHSLIFLLILSTASTAFAEPIEYLCAYPISGQYGPGPRFLFYALVISGMLLYRYRWLVGATVGTSLLMSSVAFIHSIVLVSLRRPDNVDLDIFPVYVINIVGFQAITLFNCFIPVPPSSPLNIVVAFWAFLLLSASYCSWVSIDKVQGYVCDELGSAKCPHDCNATTPLRNGQSPQAIQVRSEGLPFYPGTILDPGIKPVRIVLTVIIMTSVILNFMAAIFPYRRPRFIEGLSRQVQVFWNRHFCCFPSLGSLCQLLFTLLTVVHIISAEVPMLGPHGLPVEESMEAIGQWGPIVGAIFTLCTVFLLKKLWWDSDTGGVLDYDLEGLRQKEPADWVFWGNRAERMCRTWIALDRVSQEKTSTPLSNEDWSSITSTLDEDIEAVVTGEDVRVGWG